MIEQSISRALLILTNLSIVFLIGFHIVACRVVSKREGFKSPQMFLIKSALYMNMPLLLGIIFIASIELRSIDDVILMALFGVLIFNSLSYVYFHVFNMSETARRIRILIHLHENGPSNLRDFKHDYNPEIMVNLRLERLLEMNEITLDDSGTYRLNGKIFLFVANLFSILRKIF